VIDSSPYFFLGYAHTPERAWVDRFYKALCAEIVERTEWPTDRPVGFMDSSGIRLGEDWREAVAGALASARVLVPLYSRRYFTRPQCGFEWHAFHRRLVDHRARHGTDSTPIVPALWTPVSDEHVPEAAKHVQVDFHQVHPSYASEGLYTLIKNRAHRSTYQRVVTHLALQIISAAEQKPPLTPCPAHELDLSRNAFAQLPGDIPANRRLTIMVAAPTVHRLPGDRMSDAYGQTPTAWIPYQPDSHRPIAEAVAYIARSLDYEPEVMSLEDGLNGRDWASPDTGLGVVLFDPWLSMDPAWADQIRLVDELGADRIGVVVIWNLRDPQTRSKGEEIRKVLQAAAPRQLGDPGTPAALGAVRVHSMEEFNTHLPTVLDRALNRFLTHAQAQPPPGVNGARPQLSGPGTAPPPARSQQRGGSDGD
jgi:FxsC-like protein